MIALILIGLVIGVLSSGTGLGGGFLVVPYLILVGREAKLAVGTSFLFILLVGISSLMSHYRLGNVEWKTGLLMAAGGVLGAQIGPLLLEQVPDHIFKRVFSLLLVSTGIWLFVNSRG